MKKILLFFPILLLGCQDGIRVSKTEEPIIPLIDNLKLYDQDKNQIESCYRANAAYQTLLTNEVRCRFTAFQVFEDDHVDILGIYYSQDLLKAVVFISLGQRFSSDSTLHYNLSAYIATRKNIKEGFTLYPIYFGGQIGFEDQKLAFKRIKLYWFYSLNKDKNLNLGGKDFWERNTLFDKVKLTDTGKEAYNFQTYELPSLGNKNYLNTHFLHNVLDCSSEIDTNKTNGSNCVDLEFIFERKKRLDLE